MEKNYEKPEIEISLYLVNEAFAECTKRVNMGPSTANYTTTCSDYSQYEDLGNADGFEWDSDLTTASTTQNFYYDGDDSTCDCYYTSGNGGTILMS